jgi:hypothetical protein
MIKIKINHVKKYDVSIKKRKEKRKKYEWSMIG